MNPDQSLRLIPATLDEAEAYWALYASPIVCEYMDILPFSGLDDAQAFLERSEAFRREKKLFRYSAYIGTAFLGTACLYAWAPHNNRASVGYALREDRWGQGWGGQVLRALEHIGTTELSVHRFQATVLVDNQRSHRLLARAGYEREGVLRHYEVWPGKGPVDLVMHAKLV